MCQQIRSSGRQSHIQTKVSVAMMLALALAGNGLAGTKSPEVESLSIEKPSTTSTPFDAAPLPSTVMVMEPFKPLPLERFNEQDAKTISDIQALVKLADSPEIRIQLKSKRRPKGASGSLAAGNAAWTLGLIYLHGAGVPQDAAQAYLWFDRAVLLGARQALAGMAWCAIDGCASLPNPANADRWTTPLRSVNRPLALYLEWLAQDRLTPLRTATLDLQNSALEPATNDLKILLTAAQAGNIHALIELGLDAVARQEPEKALRYFQRAADSSEVAAINASLVAQLLQSEPQGKSDASKPGLELLTEAQRFHRGDGVPVNYSEAIRLYRLAAAKGSPEAERMLALIYSRPLVNGGFDLAWMSQLGALDLSQAAPSLRTPSQKRQLQRERTPLVDLLPAKWRGRIL